jgi:HK97 family phage major capsid protein
MSDQLRETRQKLERELGAIMDKEGALTAAECDTYERIEQELEELDIRQRDADLRERFNARQAEPATPKLTPGTAIENTASKSDEWGGYMRWFRSGGQDRSGLENRDLLTSSDAAVIPTDLQAEMVRLFGAVQGVRQAVRVGSYPTDMKVPTVATRVALTGVTGEGTAFDEVEPTFGEIDFTTDQTIAATTELSFQIMQDARPELVSEINQQHAEEIGRLWSSFYCNGLTVSTVQTDALFDSSATNVETRTFAGTTAPTAAELIRMRYDDLPAQYWNGYGDLAWVMGQGMFAEIMALLDSTGRPIFQPHAASTLATGLQGTLLGLPCYIDAAAPENATGNDAIVLLPRNAYRIVDREPGMVSQINPYAKQAEGLTQINTYMRSVGRIVRPEAIVVGTMA